LAKKRKQKNLEDLPRLVPAEDATRKAFAQALICTGSLLDIQARSVEAIERMDGVRALSGVEYRYLGEAAEAIRRAQKICLVIGRRNQRARS
jgi:hypothetical protein